MFGPCLVSPALRPYLNRGGPTVVPPLPPYSYQGMGKAHNRNVAGIDTLSVPNIGIAPGETLCVAIACNNEINVDNLSVNYGGLTMCGGTNWVYAAGAYAVFTFYTHAGGSQVIDTLTADFTLSTGEPTVAAMLATRVSTLVLGACPVPLDKTKGGLGTSGTQDSGLSAATAQAHEFLWGIIGTNGTDVDTLGTWAGPLVAGQRVGDHTGVIGTDTIDLKEGLVFVNAISTYRSEVTLATSRAYRSLLQTFKAA